MILPKKFNSRRSDISDYDDRLRIARTLLTVGEPWSSMGIMFLFERLELVLNTIKATLLGNKKKWHEPRRQTS